MFEGKGKEKEQPMLRVGVRWIGRKLKWKKWDIQLVHLGKCSLRSRLCIEVEGKNGMSEWLSVGVHESDKKDTPSMTEMCYGVANLIGR